MEEPQPPTAHKKAELSGKLLAAAVRTNLNTAGALRFAEASGKARAAAMGSVVWKAVAAKLDPGVFRFAEASGKIQAAAMGSAIMPAVAGKLETAGLLR